LDNARLPDLDPHLPKPLSDSDSYRNGHSYRYGHRDSYIYTDSDADPNAYANCNADTDYDIWHCLLLLESKP